MDLRIAIGADHAGFEYKEVVKAFLLSHGYEVKDFGTQTADSVDYPDFAHPLSAAVDKGEYERGILICGTGNGVAMTANKHQHVRAGLSWNKEVAQLIRQHNDANVLCLPARFVSEEEARAIVAAFLETAFEGGRHARRVGKMSC